MAQIERDLPVSAYRFDRFEVRSVERQLLIDGRPGTLGARAFDVRLTLVERRDRGVTKSGLLDPWEKQMKRAFAGQDFDLARR